MRVDTYCGGPMSPRRFRCLKLSGRLNEALSSLVVIGQSVLPINLFGDVSLQSTIWLVEKWHITQRRLGLNRCCAFLPCFCSHTILLIIVFFCVHEPFRTVDFFKPITSVSLLTSSTIEIIMWCTRLAVFTGCWLPHINSCRMGLAFSMTHHINSFK